MLTIDILLDGLKDDIVCQRGYYAPLMDVYGALLLDETLPLPELEAAAEHYIFVCTPERLSSVAAGLCKYPVCTAPFRISPISASRA